jgi:peptidoglycan/xylan/chitin deacetylase (PgdA/CDA1 family)
MDPSVSFVSQRDQDLLVNHLTASEVAIFLFHGVTAEKSVGIRNYTGKHVQLDDFSQLMHALAQVGSPISMDEAYRSLTGQAPVSPSSFVITFDDGFWNNLSLAAPCLADLGIPATFYLTSDFIDHNSQSWVDRIEGAIDAISVLSYKAPHPINDVFPLVTHVDKVRFMQEVRKTVKADRLTDPDNFADAILADLAPLGESTWVEALDRKLTWDEVHELANDSLFTVGGHGRTHRILGYLSEEEMQQEVTDCLDLITKGTGVETSHFSYPEGFQGSFNELLVANLQEMGVVTAVTTIPGCNSVGCDMLRLRRFFVA